MTIAYLNGQFLPLDEARVPVLDRGYLFGDGVYEVIPAYNGHIFRLSAHLQRLDRSLASIRLHNPMPRTDWESMMQALLQHNDGGNRNLAIYLQVSRGVTATRQHGLPDTPTPSILAFVWPLTGVSAQVQDEGVSAITLEDFRWHRCDIKSIALLANVMLADDALRNGHNEAILHRDGQVTEGASSNVFALFGDTVITPPANQLILHGITREFLIELAQQAGLQLREAELTVDELKSAAEIWITSSTREVFPVTSLDGNAIGNGKPGDQWRKVHTLYQQQKLH